MYDECQCHEKTSQKLVSVHVFQPELMDFVSIKNKGFSNIRMTIITSFNSFYF